MLLGRVHERGRRLAPALFVDELFEVLELRIVGIELLDLGRDLGGQLVVPSRA